MRFLKSVPGLYLAIYGLAVILIIRFMPDGIWGFVQSYLRRFMTPPPFAQAAPELVLAPAKLETPLGPRDRGAIETFRRAQSRRWRRPFRFGAAAFTR